MKVRIHCSWERWKEIMEHKPAYIHGGCKTPARESVATCIVASDGIDQSVVEWLESNGVKVVLVVA